MITDEIKTWSKDKRHKFAFKIRYCYDHGIRNAEQISKKCGLDVELVSWILENVVIKSEQLASKRFSWKALKEA